jgi:hypothetical protein
MKQEKKTTHPLEKISFPVIPVINYRGCLVAKLHNGSFSIFNRKANTGEEVDKIIDSLMSGLNQTIKKHGTDQNKSLFA